MNFECDIMSNNEAMDYTLSSQPQQTSLTNNNFQQQQQQEKQQQSKQNLISESSISPFNLSILSNDDFNTNSNTFDRLLSQTKSNTILTSNSSSNSLIDKETNESDDSIDCEAITSSASHSSLTSNFLLNQQQRNYQQTFIPSMNPQLDRNYSIANSIDTQANILQQKPLSMPSTNLNNSLIDRNVNYNDDFLNSVNKFQYILMAQTSPAIKINEDSLTYLNQGQSYELKLNRVNANSGNNKISIVNKSATDNEDFYKYGENFMVRSLSDNPNNCELYMSIIRLCFWDRKLQEIEHEEIKEWEKEYNHMKMLEIDNNLSFGVFDIRVSNMYTNAIEVIWNGKYGCSIFVKFNCTSTAFSKHKHGGEKGVHMRLQIDTFEITNSSVIKSFKAEQQQDNHNSQKSLTVSNNSPTQTPKLDFKPNFPENNDWWKHLCSSYCRIQLFRLKGAQRKLKTDRLKIERLNPPDLKRRYQASESITILCNCAFDSLYSLFPLDRNELNQRHLQLQKKSSINNEIFDSLQANLMQTNDCSKSSVALSATTTDLFHNNSNTPYFYCENEFNNTTLQKSTSLNETLEYYIENNTFFNENSTSKFGLIKELMVEDITAIIDETTDETLLGNTLSPNRRNSLAVLSTKTKLESDIITANQTISYPSIVPTSATTNNNKPIFPTSPSLSHNLSQLGMAKNNSSTHLNAQSFPAAINSQATTYDQPTTTTTTAATKQVYSAQLALCTENSTLIPTTTATKNTSMATTATTQKPSQTTTLATNIALINDASPKYVQQWLIANRFNNLLSIFKNYTSNDFLRLSKDDLIKLCGAPDAIRCFNLAHNIPITPKLTLFVKFNQQNYFYAIYLNDCKCKYLTVRLLKFYYLNEQNEQQQQLISTDNVISTQNLMNNDSSQCNNIDLDDYELFLKSKGILIKLTDEVLNNIQDESKFFIEIIQKEKTTNHQINKELMLFENDCDIKPKATNSIIMIPIID